MTQVMISYRNIDGQKEFAEILEQALAKAGFSTWIDKNNIPPLSRWEDEIFKGIKNSDFVILCLSPEYFESEICLLECYVARGYGKKLLPIIVPHDAENSLDNVYSLCKDFEETRGIEHLNFLDFNVGNVVGLREDRATMIHRLIHSITNPRSPEMPYDVFVSFKWQQAPFATRIVDDLQAAGILAFIHTRGIDIGADWRRVAWSAILKAKLHIVVLSPQIAESQYISKEVLMSRTRGTLFIPILPEEFVRDEKVKAQISAALSQNRNLADLNKYQWLMPTEGYQPFIQNLIAAIQQSL